MFKELEAKSIKEKSSIVHPNISFVKIKRKDYSCDKCGKLDINRGSMRQHIEGRIHKLNWETGESLIKKEDSNSDKHVEHNVSSNENPLLCFEKYQSKEFFEMVKTILEMKDRQAAMLLTKYFTDRMLGIELYDFLLKKGEEESGYEVEKELARRRIEDIQQASKINRN